jgi:hypothetical protein
MRSSTVGEDSQSSFAGQYSTILNAETNGIIYTEDIEDHMAGQLKIHATWALRD